MFQQPFQSLFVGLRVGTFRVSGCEMLDFMFFVERLYGAVDPSEAKGFLDSVVVCNTFSPEDLEGNTNQTSLAFSKLSASHFRQSSLFSKYFISIVLKEQQPIVENRLLLNWLFIRLHVWESGAFIRPVTYLSPYIFARNSLIWSEVIYSSYSIILSMIPFGVSSMMRLATV